MFIGTRSCTIQNVGHPSMRCTGPWVRGMGTWHHPLFTGPPIYSKKKTDWDRYMEPCPKGHFRHETKSPCPLHFKHSHWWKRRSRSKFASHYAWGTNGTCECKLDVKSTWIPTWHRMEHVSWSLGIFPNSISWRVGLTQNRETNALQKLKSIDFFYFIICEEPH